MSVCFCWMAACTSAAGMVASLFSLNVCFASTQLIAEALLVDYTNEKNLNEKEASKLQGIAWRWYFIAGAVGSILGAILIEFCSYRTIFVISAVPSVLLFIMCLYAGNIEAPTQITAGRAAEVLSEYGRSVGATFCNKMMLLIVLYNVLFYISPTLGYTNSGMGFYYYSNAMHINKGVLAYLPVLWNFLTAAGMWLYEKYFCDHYGIRQQLLMMLPVMALVQLAGSPLYASGADMPLGLGITYIVIYNAFVAGLQGALSLPTFAMCSMVCPPQIAATMYAILTSVQNQALMVATQTTVGFQEAFGISKNNFDNLWIMCIIFAAIQVIPYVSLVWPDSLGGSLVPEDLDGAVAKFHEEFDNTAENKPLPVSTGDVKK